ncbi:hypothetical protein [Ornithinimicrobium murale]|uniref:hypothetical protein n=1 Tax=Ornithinimicrobium murale TaxID=1050153 RepID=UPI000E0DDD1D|nr:hypothetical protein [Ornithinimicrobium murale]
MNTLTLISSQVVSMVPAAAVCPAAPPGAQTHVDSILGYVLWGVAILMFLGVVVGIGGLVAGRVIGMPHASKAAIGGLVMVFIAVIAYFVLPSILDTMMGSGCVVTP